MIDYWDTKAKMGMRGVDFTREQFSFSLMTAIGMNKYDAYKITIVGDKFDKVREEKSDEFNEKCIKECDILLEQNGIKTLVEFLKGEYEMQVNEHLIDTSEYHELTAKQIKNIYTKLIVNYSDNLNNASATDLVKAMGEYMKNFPPSDDGDSFGHRFITVYEPYNCICSKCNKEFDLAPNCTTVCPHCGHKYIWDEEANKFIY